METSTRTKWKRGNKTRGSSYQARRLKALSLLEEDLKKGTLRIAGERSGEPLNDSDVKRIHNEIANIKKKL